MPLTDAQKERVKLTASWLNTLGAGLLIAGAVAPLVANLEVAPAANWKVYLGSLISLALGTVLHFVAGWSLGGLDR